MCAPRPAWERDFGVHFLLLDRARTDPKLREKRDRNSRAPRVPGAQQPQQSLKTEMTIHNEHPVIFGGAPVCAGAPGSFNPQDPALPARIRGMKPGRSPVRSTKAPSILQRDGVCSGKEGKQRDLLILSRIPALPQELCSLTPGHRISMAEDRPLITGACRKLGLMGGPGSQDGVGRVDQQLPGHSHRAQGPLRSPTRAEHFGVHSMGGFWGLPW